MTDFVADLETFAEDLGFTFNYGTKAMHNLMRSNKITDEIYVLLFAPIKRSKEQTKFGGGAYTYSGDFIFGIKSNLDNVAYKQKEQDKDKGKYRRNILPLLAELKKLENVINCSDYEVINWSDVDAYNLLDSNLDGLIVTFSLKKL